MIAVLALVAQAASPGSDVAKAPDDMVTRALLTEMHRSRDGLHLPDAPAIYHLRYHAMLMTQVDLRASFGALFAESTDPFGALGIELRVGTPAYDNTGFGGWQNGFSLAWLPNEVTEEAIRIDAWRMTDRAYKQAVEQYARKKAQFTPPDDYPGDYVMTGGTIADLGQPPTPDTSALQALVREVSAGFVVADGVLERGELDVGQESGAHWIVDSEGTRVREPLEECTLRAFAHARAEDGLLLTDSLLWTVRRPDQLPPATQMKTEVEQLAEHLVALAKAPSLEDEYVGPVIFEDGAAADLFRYLLVPQIEGTPPEVPFDSWFGDVGDTGNGTVRVGRRVLPPGWTVTDDPTEHPEHPGSFAYDIEGTPAQRVELVGDGIVHTLLMSRVPRKELVGSNGHGRGSLGERAQGRAAILDVTPPDVVGAAKLRKKAMKLALAYGRDWVVVVKHLQEPAVLAAQESGSFFMFGGDEDAAALPPPVSIWRVYADGREQELKGAAFAGVHRWVLRDIVAAGPRVDSSFMAADAGQSDGSLSPTEGLPTRVQAAAVLIGEMELVPQNGDPRDVPLVPAPPAP